MLGPTIRLLITVVILWGIAGPAAASPAQASGVGMAGTLSPASGAETGPAGSSTVPATGGHAMVDVMAPWHDPAAAISIQARAVSTGLYFTCALTTYRGIKCWGYNVYGQLGDGTTERRTSPVDVVELSSGVATVDTGNSHTCAVTTGGRVKCWGYNSDGQVGDDTEENRSIPVNVVGLASGVSAVSAGGSHSCALTTGGGVKCWGNNSSGQLGDGTQTDRTIPVQVGGLSSGVAAIAAGDNHTCALTTSGGVKCWGGNGSGQLGDGTKTNRPSPVDVAELSSGVAAIITGNLYTCALTTGGGAKCWGDNAYGKLGDDTTVDKTAPVDVMGLFSGVATIALAAGGHHTCAVTASGGAKCWGLNNYGQLGDASKTDHWTPVDVVGLYGGVVAASAGAYHTCALTVGGGVKCWGRNTYGQLGDDTLIDRSTHGDVQGLEGSVYTMIAKSGSSVVLAWLHMVTTVEHYELYRSATAPYCEPGGPDSVKLSPEPLAPPDTATEVTFTDTGALALPDAIYFYAVVPVSYGDEFYATSNRTGAYSYGLVPGSGARSIR